MLLHPFITIENEDYKISFNSILNKLNDIDNGFDYEIGEDGEYYLNLVVPSEFELNDNKSYKITIQYLNGQHIHYECSICLKAPLEFDNILFYSFLVEGKLDRIFK